ncbi:MAG: DUF2027 domain-containing protein [Duncaniella sp.]|nr:DUF2027 domain-containing protein [Duncaniella sp.]
MAKIGDIVRFLNSVGGGVVTRIEGNIAYVDDDGFETPMLLRECVVVGQATAEEKPKAAPSFRASATAAPAAPARNPQPEPEPEPIEETPEGEKLNVVLAYEPSDIKQLSSTTFNTYLVNDSNYFLYFSYLTRADGSEGWVTRYAGVVEPNIQIWLEEFEAAQLAQMDRVAVQLFAVKQGKEFTLKCPVSVEMKLDTRKFFKLHCFNTGIYFDEPVIALDIVRDDRAVKPASVDAVAIEKGIKEKKAVDRRRPVRPLRPKKADVRRGEIIEVDLHIHELVDNTAGLSPADMLNLQIDEFRRVMDANMRNKGQKIVFIHGKGEGVLRQAILKELNHRYKGHDVQDASFREYGFGATQVTI